MVKWFESLFRRKRKMGVLYRLDFDLCKKRWKFVSVCN
jgi:hypothetical protein